MPPRPSAPGPAARRTGLAAVSLLLLTGCFAEGSGTSSAGGAGGSTDGRIELAMLQPPRSGLSPLSDDAFKLSRWSTAETLVRLDEAGDAQPMLATAWEQLDDTTWSFTIRDGVTFHDGTELTAENAAASLARAVEAEPAPRILDGVEMSVAAEGDTVRVTTAGTDPLVPQRLSSPQLSVLAPAAYEGTAVTPVGHGTGPFELTAVDGTSGATLERYDDHWAGAAAAAGIDVSFVPDGTARAAALRTGEADVVEAVPVGQAAQVEEDLLDEVPMPRTNTLYLNTEDGPFADPALRAAAREALDPQRIVDGVYEGRADAAAGLLGPAIPYAAEGRGHRRLPRGAGRPRRGRGPGRAEDHHRHLHRPGRAARGRRPAPVAARGRRLRGGARGARVPVHRGRRPGRRLRRLRPLPRHGARLGRPSGLHGERLRL
ncbi:ABC transporter substrate-binding protein [Kocuria rosea]|uniref:ABC transporter substrate-binding protein n=1 Tax=Kocuria rosea TaxID=1275 RepID=UPI002FDF7E8E